MKIFDDLRTSFEAYRILRYIRRRLKRCPVVILDMSRRVKDKLEAANHEFVFGPTYYYHSSYMLSVVVGINQKMIDIYETQQ